MTSVDRRSGGLCVENIACPTHSLDDAGVVGVNFFSQVGDMHHNCTGVSCAVSFPDMAVQLIIKQQGVGVVGKIEQQIVFDGGQRNGLSVPVRESNAMVFGVNGKAGIFSCAKRCRLYGCRTMSAQVRFNARQHFVIIERFYHIVIPAGLQCMDDGLTVILAAGK